LREEYVGCFTLLASELAPKGEAFSFEPEPANFEMLEGNVRRNGLDGIRLFQMAMAGCEGEREPHRSLKKSTTGGHSLYVEGRGSVTVETITLDRVARDHWIDRIDFLKRDCEGAEWDLLRFAPRDVLDRTRGGAERSMGTTSRPWCRSSKRSTSGPAADRSPTISTSRASSP
jgi:FkbM family methyltransferase